MISINNELIGFKTEVIDISECSNSANVVHEKVKNYVKFVEESWRELVTLVYEWETLGSDVIVKVYIFANTSTKK